MNPSTCPFCNAPLPPLASTPTAAKLPCPRCGELVAADRWPIDPHAQDIQAGEPAPRTTQPDTKTHNRKTAFVVVGIMLTMAALGLAYALWTVDLRKSRHPWMPKQAEEITQRRPLQLSGLGYLPKNCELVAGLQIAEMMTDKDGAKKLLDEPRPAVLDFVLRQVPRSTGMTLEEIDHIVVGAAIDANFPQAVMIVKTRAPYELEKIARSTKAATPPLYQDRPLYRYSLNPVGEALIWCVEPRTLVYVVRLDEPKAENLNGLAVTPRSVEEALSASLRQTIEERLGTPQFFWAAGRLDQLGAVKDWLPLAFGGKADLGIVKNVKGFTLGMAPDKGLTLTGNFHVNDAKTVERMTTLLEGVNVPGAKSQKVEATPADAAEQWVTWQVRGDVTALREVLNGNKDGKK